MRIERTPAGATITIDEPLANEWARDPYNVDSEEISEELRDLGFGLSDYDVTGSVDVTINFTVRVRATSEDEAADLVRDNAMVEGYEVGNAFSCEDYEGECDQADVGADVGCVDIDSVEMRGG